MLCCFCVLICISININAQTYILTYDHIGSILWGDERYAQNLYNAVDLLEKYPGFKIGQDNEAYSYDAFAESNPELLEELQHIHQRFPERFGIGSCTYGQPLSTFINEESNVRQLVYAVRTNNKYFNSTPPVYAMSEHAMHSQLPQLLIGTGFKGAIMRTHFTMYGYNPSFDAAVGWWVGPDGSKITCIPTYGGEGFAWPWSKFDNVTKDNNSLTRYPYDTDYSLRDFSEEFKEFEPRLASRLDDAKLRYEELIIELQEKPEFQWVILEDLMDLYPEPVESFNPGANDFKTRMPWGYCGNEIWDGYRESEISVLIAERLAALEVLAGGQIDQDLLEKAWKNLLVAQHHDIQITGRVTEARKFISTSLSSSKEHIQSSLSYLASKLNPEGIAQITLFNPVSWSRSEWIESEIQLEEGQADHIELHFKAKTIPFEIVSLEKYRDGSISNIKVRFKATLPAMSVCAISVMPGSERYVQYKNPVVIDTLNFRIISDEYIIQFADSGYLSSIVDRKSLKTLAKNGFITGFIDGKEYHPNGIWTFEGSNFKAIAKQSGHLGPLPYELEMVIRQDQKRIECKLKVSCYNQQIGLEHFIHDSKLRFKIFPEVNESAFGVRDLPFMIAKTNSKWIEGNYWTMLTDNTSGLAYFNRGAMGSVHEVDGGFSIPFLYSGTYKWGPKYVSGTFVYEFAIYPWTGDIDKEDIHRRALEYEFPIVAISGQTGKGGFGHYFQPLEINSENIILSALYPENGKVIARMYEYMGDTGILNFQLITNKVSEMIEVDLLGDMQSTVHKPLQFKPRQIRSFMISTY